MGKKKPDDPIKSYDSWIDDMNCADLGIPTSLLMENAGCQSAETIIQEYGLNNDSKAVIFCGIGNNGGDGFVIARHLASRGISVLVILAGDPDKIRTEEARLNWKIINKLSLKIRIEIMYDSALRIKFREEIESSNVIIDCLLGTGVKGTIREPIATAITLINSSSLPKIAIDVPSGMDPNTGEIPDIAVKCDLLLTFHRDKPGLQNIANKRVLSIGIPLEASMFVGIGDLKAYIPHRDTAAFKGQYGKVLIIAGSKSYSGAPSFAALAALEFGVDLCILMVPKSVSQVVRSYSPSIIVREASDEYFTSFDIPLAKELISWADAILIGPGIGTDPDTNLFFDELLTWLKDQHKPTVIDADGLKFLGKSLKQEFQDYRNFPLVVTPHLGELKALFDFENIPSYNDIENRGTFLKQLAQQLSGGVILLKGVYDYIATDEIYRVNLTGRAEMAVGGTGDVLAGLVVAFLSLKVGTIASACCAAYINGKLGELVCQRQGKRLQAMDLIHGLDPFLKSVDL